METQTAYYGSPLAAADSLEAAAEIVCDGLKIKLDKVLNISVEQICP